MSERDEVENPRGYAARRTQADTNRDGLAATRAALARAIGGLCPHGPNCTSCREGE